MKIIKSILKPLFALFKGLYLVLDTILITPVSKLVYKSRDLLKNNNSKIEKILNMPNVLIYFSLICAIGLFLQGVITGYQPRAKADSYTFLSCVIICYNFFIILHNPLRTLLQIHILFTASSNVSKEKCV